MRNWKTCVLAVIGMLALGSLALAKAPATQPSKKAHPLRGKIQTVTPDSADRSIIHLVITSGGKKNATTTKVDVNSKTVVQEEGKTVATSELAAGQRVNVTGTPDDKGVVIATEIKVMKAGHARAAHVKRVKPAGAI